MAESRFYWIKLKLNMLTSKIVDFLMSQKDGANYVILYQMLCLLTINSNGELADYIGEVIIPFDEAKIQRDTKYFNIDTIRVALGLYQKLGLVYVQENGILKIADFENLIGSESKWAGYKRKERLENVQSLSNNMSKESPPRDKSIDNRVIDINNNSSNYIYSPNLKENPPENKSQDDFDLSLKLKIETIFNAWNNAQNTIHHNEITEARKKAIEKILKNYSVEEVIHAIGNYDLILGSNWYFNYKWSLEDFMNRKNGISTFTNEGSNWNSFQEDLKKNPLLLPTENNNSQQQTETKEIPSFFTDFLNKI